MEAENNLSTLLQNFVQGLNGMPYKQIDTLLTDIRKHFEESCLVVDKAIIEDYKKRLQEEETTVEVKPKK